jgi:hypothetical protein
MALSQKDVDAFMAAQKVVPSTMPGGTSHRMTWDQSDPLRCLWGAPVEVNAIQVGELVLFMHPQIERTWRFKLDLHGEEVYRWDIRPIRAGHTNPKGGCPEGFSNGKVRGKEHEHVWAPNLGCNCAGDLYGLDTSTHERMFVQFCVRTRLDCGPDYVAPTPNRELPFHV